MHKKSTRKDIVEIFLDTQNWIEHDSEQQSSSDIHICKVDFTQ